MREHQPELDELIAKHARGWSLERIAPLERSILRVGLAELLYPDELPGEQAIPPEGAINEAVETAKRFCGAEAPGVHQRDPRRRRCATRRRVGGS